MSLIARFIFCILGVISSPVCANFFELWEQGTLINRHAMLHIEDICTENKYFLIFSDTDEKIPVSLVQEEEEHQRTCMTLESGRILYAPYHVDLNTISLDQTSIWDHFTQSTLNESHIFGLTQNFGQDLGKKPEKSSATPWHHKYTYSSECTIEWIRTSITALTSFSQETAGFNLGTRCIKACIPVAYENKPIEWLDQGTYRGLKVKGKHCKDFVCLIELPRKYMGFALATEDHGTTDCTAGFFPCTTPDAKNWGTHGNKAPKFVINKGKNILTGRSPFKL